MLVDRDPAAEVNDIKFGSGVGGIGVPRNSSSQTPQQRRQAIIDADGADDEDSSPPPPSPAPAAPPAPAPAPPVLPQLPFSAPAPLPTPAPAVPRPPSATQAAGAARKLGYSNLPTDLDVP